MEKVRIQFSDAAAGEFDELSRHKVLGGLARRYLKELEDFPPKTWGEIRRQAGQDYFRSDHHVIFDIQGKLLLDVQGLVRITRFRLRRRG